jgi:hypothetical protein
VNREPSFDELVGAETSGEERERLRHVHELLLEAGPPPELPAKLRNAPGSDPGVVRLQRRRVVKRRGLLLLAAALSIVVVFAAGYAVSNSRQSGGASSASDLAKTVRLAGTRFAPNAKATLDVWEPQAGNWPMTLSVVGLKRLPAHDYYYVYLVRDGKPWAPCGAFRVASSSQTLILTLNAPYKLRKGDTWVVTRPTHRGEPGSTVMRPVTA